MNRKKEPVRPLHTEAEAPAINLQLKKKKCAKIRTFVRENQDVRFDGFSCSGTFFGVFLYSKTKTFSSTVSYFGTMK